MISLSCCSNDDDVPVPDTPLELTDETSQLIVDWSDMWVSVDQFTNGMRPNSVTRSLAYIHLAGYETAVPFMDNYSSNSDRLSELEIDFDEMEDDVNLELALNETYSRVVDHFMFDFQPFTVSR